MKRKTISILLFLVVSLLLTACEEYVSPIMFQVSDAKKIPTEFPATVEVDYYIANHVQNLYGEDKYITFKWVRNGKVNFYKAYPVKKTNDGYIIMGSEQENYAIPNPSKFGYSDIFPLTKKNGTFTMTFENQRYFNDFFDDYMRGLDEVCSYYSCLPEKDK